MHIADLATTGLVHLLDVPQDPIEVVEGLFVRCGNDRLVASPFILGFPVHPENHRLAGRAHQGRVEIRHTPGGLPLNGQDVVAGADFDTDLRERTAILGVPVVSAKNALDAEITTGIGLDDSSQQPQRNPLWLGQITAAHIGVSDVQLPDHLPDDEGEVGPMLHMRQQGLITTAHARPVHPVQLRIEEEIPHLSPALVVNLVPFRTAIQTHLQIAQAQLAIGEVELGGREIQNRQFRAHLDQHLLAIGRDPEPGHLAQLCFLFLLEVEEVEFALFEIE